MAHHYPGMPPYGTGYPAPPHHTLYNGNTMHAIPPSPSSYGQINTPQLNPQAPVIQANDLRFHANMQLPPQPAAFPFPPNLNPDLLKHFPPPPPHPAGFPTGPATPAAYGHVPQTLNDMSQSYPQPTYRSLADIIQPNTGSAMVQNPFSTSANMSNAQDRVQELGNSISVRPGSNTGYDVSQHSHDYAVSGIQALQSMSDGQRGDGEFPSRVPQSYFQRGGSNLTQRIDQQHSEFPQAQAESPEANTPNILVPPKDTYAAQPEHLHSEPSAELREQAKAAILSLASHKITYNELVVEGIDAEILRNLFTELGMDWSKKNDTEAARMEVRNQSVEITPVTEKSQVPANTSAARSSATALSASQTDAVSLAVERKDRIAQLLAAKAAKNSPPNTRSQPASPAPASENTLPQKLSISTDSNALQKTLADAQSSLTALAMRASVSNQFMKQQPLVPDNGEALNKDVIPAQKAWYSGIASVPTPVKKSLIENGLSSLIPGLFLTAEEESAESTLSVPAKDGHPSLEEVANISGNTLSNTNTGQKRPAPDASTESLQGGNRKRRISSLSGRNDVDMELDGSESGEASEGEIIEEMGTESAKIDRQQWQPQEQAVSHAASSISPPVRAGQTGSSDRPSSQIYTLAGRGPLSRTQSFLSSPSSSTPITPTTDKPALIPSGPSSQRQPVSEAITTKHAAIGQRPISKLTPIQLAERAAQLKADLMRQRKIRQQQLNEGIPALDDEVLKTQQRIAQSKAKLDEIRDQLQKFEVEAARARESERELVAEISRLEKQLQEGVIGQKQFSKELKDIGKQNDIESAHGNVQARTIQAMSAVGGFEHTIPDSQARAPSMDTGLSQAAMQMDQQQVMVESSLESPIRRQQDGNLATGAPSPKRENPEQTDSTVNQNEQFKRSSVPPQTINDPQHRNSHRKEVSTIETSTSLEYNKGQANQMPPIHATASESDDSRMSLDDDDVDHDDEEDDGEEEEEEEEEEEDDDDDGEVKSDGSASMSDSGSDDYEPAEPERHYVDRHREESTEYEPEEPVNAPTYLEDVADDYEPSENVEAASLPKDSDDVHPSVIADLEAFGKNQVSYAFDAETANGAVPISDVGVQFPAAGQGRGLQLSETDTASKSQTLANQPEEDPVALGDGAGVKLPQFVPYQSPLSSFKSYRFNPSFSDQVKTGYRSLTYSNKIDPKIPLCPSELAGEVCNDPDCQEQHFGSMVLTDDKILVQMSSAIDITDKGLRDDFLQGLKVVIASLRQEGVKEFSDVANALSKYRRDWSASHLSI